MRFFFYIIFVNAVLLTACSGGSNKETAADPRDSSATAGAFNWPQGKYLYVNGGGMYYEEWAKGDSGTYKGAGFFINQNSNDTLFSTTMHLRRKKDKTTLFYVVKGQSDNKDVEFMLTKEDDNVFVFENPFRDFPSIMQYKILGDTAIEVTQRGFVNNHENVKVYTVKKID